MTACWQDTVLCMLDNNEATLYDLLAFQVSQSISTTVTPFKAEGTISSIFG